ncbi:MAG: Lrp/AsnC family transcriptional regulator [Lachnospiraceae bacterium]|nr:Lrp/AsnC family transcriptional regulator [Lachnospiraceae bacterium]
MKEAKTEARYNLDEVDEQILTLLEKDARMSLKEIAECVYLSSTAVSGRIERLKENGIIKGFRVQINPSSLGYFIKAFINVEVDPNDKPNFYPFVEQCKNVVECSCVTGEYSMIMEVIFETTDDLDQFVGELQRFGKTKTLIAFSTSIEHRDIYWKRRENAQDKKEE